MASTDPHTHLPLPDVSGARVLIVRAPYYSQIAEMQLAGARAALDAAGVSHDLIDVPGALEIPTTIGFASGYDGFVALGCVIRGETTHYETVCEESARGITHLGLRGLAIGNGILTVENQEQAVARADPDQMNKGGGAAEAALHLIAARRRFGTAARRDSAFAPDSEHIIIAGND